MADAEPLLDDRCSLMHVADTSCDLKNKITSFSNNQYHIISRTFSLVIKVIRLQCEESCARMKVRRDDGECEMMKVESPEDLLSRMGVHNTKQRREKPGNVKCASPIYLPIYSDRTEKEGQKRERPVPSNEEEVVTAFCSFHRSIWCSILKKQKPIISRHLIL